MGDFEIHGFPLFFLLYVLMTCQFLTYILAAHCTSHAILQSGSCAIYTSGDTALVELDHKESTVEIRRIVYIVVEDRPFHVAEVGTSGMLHCNQRLMLYSWRTVDLVCSSFLIPSNGE